MERDYNDDDYIRDLYNFNSRAHVERDSGVRFPLTPFQNFNSRAHVERDSVTFMPPASPVISTHALTWSATIWYGLDNYTVADFNSRAHVERDPNRAIKSAGRGYFNSRAHVERDGKRDSATAAKLNFNSRAHVERD